MKLSKKAKLLAVPAVIIGSLFIGVGVVQAKSPLAGSLLTVETMVEELSKEQLSCKKPADVSRLKGAGDQNGRREGR